MTKTSWILVEKGANIDAMITANATDGNGTPLHLVVWKYHLDIVKCLVAKGAKLQAIYQYNETPLQYVVKYDHHNIVEYHQN